MIQLSYQPAFDPYHAIYRFLRLRNSIKKPLPKDHARILDFYLLFPFRISALRMQRSHQKYRRLASVYASEKPYGELPDDRALITRMTPIQIVALDTLATKELIDAQKYREGLITPVVADLPRKLQQQIDTDNAAQVDLMEFLQTLAAEYELLGVDGLKHRSNLLEYRYDAI